MARILTVIYKLYENLGHMCVTWLIANETRLNNLRKICERWLNYTLELRERFLLAHKKKRIKMNSRHDHLRIMQINYMYEISLKFACT